MESVKKLLDKTDKDKTEKDKHTEVDTGATVAEVTKVSVESHSPRKRSAANSGLASVLEQLRELSPQQIETASLPVGLRVRLLELNRLLGQKQLVQTGSRALTATVLTTVFSTLNTMLQSMTDGRRVAICIINYSTHSIDVREFYALEGQTREVCASIPAATADEPKPGYFSSKSTYSVTNTVAAIKMQINTSPPTFMYLA